MADRSYHAKIADVEAATPSSFRDHSCGYAVAELVGAQVGATHTQVTLCTLAHGGVVDEHATAFERAIYMLSGGLELASMNSVETLITSQYAHIPVGAVVELRNGRLEPARWLQAASPQPRTDPQRPDVFFAPTLPNGAAGVEVRIGDFQQGTPGGGEALGLDMGKLTGAALTMLVDVDRGAHHLSLFMVEYGPDGRVGRHDHPFEEAYFFLRGRLESEVDGVTRELAAGDVLWTGVGSAHAFRNTSGAPVTWLETQAPLPPRHDAARFDTDWLA